MRALRDRERAAAELKELILLGAGNRVDRLDNERGAVHRAEDAVTEHREALLEIARARLELHMLVATELAIAEEHDAKAELLDGARVLEGVTRHQAEQADGGPVGIDTIAAALSESRDAIEEIVEPYLIQQGFLQRTPRGRTLTAHAYKHLGMAAPQRQAGQDGLFEA